MPDLSSDAVISWLREREPNLPLHEDGGSPPIDDHAAVLPAVVRLGTLLDGCHARQPAALCARLKADRGRATTRAVLAQLGRARRLRLLHWLGGIAGLEDLPADLLREATSETGAFLRAEMLALHRGAALNRIFGEDRIAALLAACNLVSGWGAVQ